WRELARNESAKDVMLELGKKDLKRWPHQLACLAQCQKFLTNSKRFGKWVEATTQQDFFVEMATGTGKSLVMTDLLAGLGLGPGKACIIVPKLDLMEQLADLLEETLPFRISRVGTGYPADLSAQLFVCVRNSAWQLQNLTFELQILDEAHHYEPSSEDASGNETVDGVHAMQVLGLDAKKRIFFSATLLRNKPDFEFGLRPAIEAGIISDYSVMVPILTAGDPRPGLVELIQDLPMARKILAFCNTVDEARYFTRLLNSKGIPADHYNGHTSKAHRQQILRSFGRSPAHGGIRVLVTVDVLSEGVDLPCADTCLFVAPRHAVRLRQCVGRVLRKHPRKIDAMVIAPPLSQVEDGTLVEDIELGRLLMELAQADLLLRTSISQTLKDASVNSRISVYSKHLNSQNHDPIEEAARLLRLRVFPSLFKTNSMDWELGFRNLTAYHAEHGHVRVPSNFETADGGKLGTWIRKQRHSKAKRKLCQERVERLNSLGMVWDPFAEDWELGFRNLTAYHAEHGHVRVPFHFETADGGKLGTWVGTQRNIKAKGKLCQERVERLNSLCMVWDPLAEDWELGFRNLTAYHAEHGHVGVPKKFETADGDRLGRWVQRQRNMKAKGKLGQERVERLNSLGMVWDPFAEDWQRNMKAKGKLCQERVERLNSLGMLWDPFAEDWELGFRNLTAYHADHGHVRVPFHFETADGGKLGTWVGTQRNIKAKGKLCQERVERLNSLGMLWDPLAEDWELGFRNLTAYHAEHGHVRVPKKFETADGDRLGRWVQRQRNMKAKGKLGQERVERLKSLGMVWDPLAEDWELGFRNLTAYHAEHGHVRVPFHFKTADGGKLGTWVGTQRNMKAKGKLCQERVERLNSLCMVWDPFAEDWELGFRNLTAYHAEHGHVGVPKKFETADGGKLGTWVGTQRNIKAKGKLGQERVERLNSLGMVWDPLAEDWELGFRNLTAYHAEHGHVRVPFHFKTADGGKLGTWVGTQRNMKAKGKLYQERAERLNSLCMVWDPLAEDWELGFRNLTAYHAEHGHVRVPFHFETADGGKLGIWVQRQRNMKAKGKLGQVMMDCMCEAGRDVLNDPEKVKDPVSFITAILNLKYKYDRFVKESFKESKDFQLALKQAFESFLNKDTRTAQYLSLYVDDQFRKGLKGMSSDADVDTALEQVVTVFRFLQDKDVFENFYKQHLSRRLLTGRLAR
ncbi:unnamed protein product, partial [Cladocopium goreaui]